MYRLTAFDMDGTLLTPAHRVGSETLAVLNRLIERGVIVAFATGRHYLDARSIMVQLGLKGYLITGNGTRVYDSDGWQLHATDLAADVAEELLHSDWGTQASMHVFRDEGWLTGYAVPGMLEAHHLSGFCYQLADLRRLPAFGNSKVCFCGPHEALISLQGRLLQHFGARIDVCFSAYDCLDVLPHGCNKGTALAYLTEHLGLRLADCMAFGDAMNDKEMLAAVGCGLVMGNALPQLKAQLPQLQVIGHCEHQAVAHYLQHWLSASGSPYTPV
ncbi:HMP-PP phosphatase [Gibbsiella quercinecans]|uniref:HMP-PP phosphatase n=1 Tax=Gibbsiella quercinecans TaxID=929813 RepID=A0A250AYH6_9GAMM|nr:HMP-PP phosphatase [Gibbsiella quercinecans]ATA18989.1 thiamin pyrimidine pyrophosphate hydrolase [Gibbsiella quercinecans]RLM03315.1 thiamine pyrimidine pyrophosphate hydrolase [Gibbsiella quercinecans]RLM12193.1 thiamine pyrimidine pyrophosphate hydrolase [Gibbsiella quercinecans]TCT81338.1 HMP-PP phosphatase [Gibbsiella quercinecans]